MVVIKMSSWLTAIELVYGAREAERDDSLTGTRQLADLNGVGLLHRAHVRYDKVMYPARTLLTGGALVALFASRGEGWEHAYVQDPASILSSDWRICFSEFEELILVDFDSSNLIPEVKRTDRAAACFARLLSVCKYWHHMYYPVVLCILRDRRSRAMFAAGYRASASRSLKGLGLTQHWTVRFGPLFLSCLSSFPPQPLFCGDYADFLRAKTLLAENLGSALRLRASTRL